MSLYCLLRAVINLEPSCTQWVELSEDEFESSVYPIPIYDFFKSQVSLSSVI